MKPPPADPRIAQWTPLVHKIAQQYYRRLWRWHEYDDLVSIGLDALWRATQYYEPVNPVAAQFQTYAYRCVVFAFNHEIKYSKAKRRRERANSLSLDELMDEGYAPPEVGTRPLTSEQILIEREEVTAIDNAMEALTPREAEIIVARIRGLTLLEIGAQKQLSRERIRQLERKALQRLSCALRGSFRERQARPLAGLSFGADER